MLNQDLNQIDSDFLQRICDDKRPESETLDFKRELPGTSDKAKHELLKDVCAMANANGGDLVYGIAECQGFADSIVAATTEAPDAASRRITQVLEAGLEPRVIGIRVHNVPAAGGYVLIVRIPASYDGPHCIRSNSNRRFVARNGTGTADMNYEQIRSAFDRTATLAEKGRHFIAARQDLIAQRTSSTPIVEGPVWSLHLVPLAGIAERHYIDLRPIHAKTFPTFAGSDWGGASRSFNFDGLVVHPGGVQEDGYYAYNHIFRTGVLEAAQIGGAKREVTQGGPERSIVWSLDMSKFFHSTATHFMTSAISLGFAGPALLGVAMLTVQDFELGIGDAYQRFGRARVDRPNLIPPVVWIDNLETASVDDAIRPSLDALWQAFDQERCLDFDEQIGTYKPRKR